MLAIFQVPHLFEADAASSMPPARNGTRPHTAKG
jgi:hypothetical protein